MIIFDSNKSSGWTGTGFSLENKKIRCLQMSFLRQRVTFRSGEYQVKFAGRRNSGNGTFLFEIFKDKDCIISKKFNFINNNLNSLVFNFFIDNPSLLDIKITRGGESIGTILFDSIRITKTSDLIEKVNLSPIASVLETKLYKKEDVELAPISKDGITFLIDDLDIINPNLEKFIRDRRLSFSSSKILNLIDGNSFEKKYSNLLDSRVFNVLDDLIDFIKINEPDGVFCFSKNEIFDKIKESVSCNFFIVDNKNKREDLTLNQKGFEKKKIVFDFEGRLV
jgi:hypothetical protein